MMMTIHTLSDFLRNPYAAIARLTPTEFRAHNWVSENVGKLPDDMARSK
jgi:DNA-binding CsgD family transcriptional regulator